MISCSHWGIFAMSFLASTDGIDWDRYWFATHDERAALYGPHYWA